MNLRAFTTPFLDYEWSRAPGEDLLDVRNRYQKSSLQQMSIQLAPLVNEAHISIEFVKHKSDIGYRYQAHYLHQSTFGLSAHEATDFCTNASSGGFGVLLTRPSNGNRRRATPRSRIIWRLLMGSSAQHSVKDLAGPI